MYEYIKGRYIGINKDYIIVENNGIGYKIFTSGATMAEMPKVNEEIMLYLEQIVREDFIGLYGFKDREELEMFKLLILCFTAETIITLRELSIVFQYVLLLYAV